MSFNRVRVYPPNPSTARGSPTKLGSIGNKIIYANGKSIVIRDLNDSRKDILYSGHVHPTTVARISPSGYYAASADIQGNVRIWDIVGADQTLKAEYKVLSGKINDLSWDGESKRIIAVGDGREKFGHVFQIETGSSAGEIAGHAKALNAVAIRHLRPFRAATAGDDGSIVFHTGAPYKYDKTLKAHTNFVHSVAYASSGAHFLSTGADSKAILWDGVSGERVGELLDGGAHTGSVYAGSWASDNRNIVTSSADCTVKLWDVETRKLTTTWSLGNGIASQQSGNIWTNSGIVVSLSMSGVLNIFDPREGRGPISALYGPQKSITSTSIFTTSASSTFLAGSADGHIFTLSVTGEDGGDVWKHVSHGGHTNLVSGIASTGAHSWSVGFDDHVRELEVPPGEDAAFLNSTYGPTASQPRAVAVSKDGHVFVAEASHIEALRSGQRVCVLDVRYGVVSVDVSDQLVAVGGEDAKVHLYQWNVNGTLTDVAVLEGTNKGPVSAVAFAPGGRMLAAGDSTGKIVVYDIKERKASISRWTYHSARIHSLAWTADGAHVASASLDTHVYVWSMAKPTANIAIKNAGPGGVWGVRWVPSNDSGARGKLLSAGADGAVRMWEVIFHA